MIKDSEIFESHYNDPEHLHDHEVKDLSDIEVNQDYVDTEQENLKILNDRKQYEEKLATVLGDFDTNMDFMNQQQLQVSFLAKNLIEDQI